MKMRYNVFMYKYKQLSGFFIFLAFNITLISYFFEPKLLLYAGLCMWTALFLVFRQTSNIKLLLVLLTFSFMFFTYSYLKGFEIDFEKAILVNQYLVVLLLGVGFLKLIASPKAGQGIKLPKGKKAFLKTYLGVHLFGSVINLSSLVLVGDKLYKKAPLSKMQVILLTRAFSSDAYWSPFFVAFAAASTYAPNLSVPVIFTSGLFLAFIAFILTYLELINKTKYDIDEFKGYPIHFETLYIPVLLAFLVLLTNKYYPDLKVILLIPLYSIVLTAIILPLKEGPIKAYPKLTEHIFEDLPKMKNEIALFIVAGMFGVSVSTVFVGHNIYLPFSCLDGFSASLVLLVLILLSFIGIHPIISIAIIGNWMMELNHTLLASAFLMSWATAVSTSPFSGLNLTMQARYKLKGKELFFTNIPYALKMYVVCVIILFIIANYLGL